MTRRMLVAAGLLALTFTLTSCSSNDLVAFDAYDVFGTQARWVYVSKDKMQENRLKDEILSLTKQVDDSLSLSNEKSFLNKLNAAAAGETVEVDSVTYAALSAAYTVYQETNGAYNPASGLLVDLWGFSPRHTAVDYVPTMPYDRIYPEQELPERTYCELFSDRELCNFDAVEMYEEGGRFFVKKPDVVVEADGVEYTMRLNLGGIGKGYCVDAVSALLGESGRDDGYYSLGGSSLALFTNPKGKDGVWEVSLNSPREQFGSVIATLRVKNSVLSVSGDYEQYYEINGVRYCHIVNAVTGQPVGEGSHVVYATVVGGSAALGDARATAIVAMDLQEALSYASAHACEFGVMFVWYDMQSDEYVAYSNLGDALTMSADIRLEVIA